MLKRKYGLLCILSLFIFCLLYGCRNFAWYYQFIKKERAIVELFTQRHSYLSRHPTKPKAEGETENAIDTIIHKKHKEIPLNVCPMRLSSYRDGVEIFGKEFLISSDFLRSVNFPIEEFIPLNDDTVKKFEIVTAVSDNHVREVTGLITSMQKYMPHKRLFIYNVGLSDENWRMLSSYCGVTIVPFDFNKYPDHIRILHSYGFKTAVVHEALCMYTGIFFVDACQEFTTSDLTQAFNLVLNTTRGFAGFSVAGHNIFSFTHPDMYQYFLTDIDKIRPLMMVESGNYLFYRTKQMYEMFKPWFLCSMDRDCIAPKGSRQDCVPGPQVKATMNDTNKAGCHRYDQSALNLVLARSYGYKWNFGFLDAALSIAPVKCNRDRKQVTNLLLKNSSECLNSR